MGDQQKGKRKFMYCWPLCFVVRDNKFHWVSSKNLRVFFLYKDDITQDDIKPLASLQKKVLSFKKNLVPLFHHLKLSTVR
jgi:hypothetical protein